MDIDSQPVANPYWRYRRLGEGAALFDEHTWKTHILSPAAAISFEALGGPSRHSTIPMHEAVPALEHEFGLKADSEELAGLLVELKRIGVIA